MGACSADVTVHSHSRFNSGAWWRQPSAGARAPPSPAPLSALPPHAAQRMPHAATTAREITYFEPWGQPLSPATSTSTSSHVPTVWKRINVTHSERIDSRKHPEIVARITTHSHLHTCIPGGCLARRMVHVTPVIQKKLWGDTWMVWNSLHYAARPPLRHSCAALCAHQIPRRYLSRRWRAHIIYFQWFFVSQLVFEHTFELWWSRWSMKKV